MKKLTLLLLATLLLSQPLLLSARQQQKMSREVLMDKIKGGWGGQTIGCAFGGPTEFCYRGIMIPDETEIQYPEHHLKLHYDRYPGLFDDVYMDLTFVKVFSEEGLDASAESMACLICKIKVLKIYLQTEVVPDKFLCWPLNSKMENYMTLGMLMLNQGL